jgi:phthiocerol/phenolphthiocerol synthesis type-I polyketide synthase E
VTAAGPDELAAEPESSDIAVIGLACRFPGARDSEQFWRLVRDGTEAISFFAEAELREEGIPASVTGRPDYVPAKGVLDDPDRFDASFFGYSPRDAAAIDPQQRLFLECAWEALEDAAIDPGRAAGPIGVYAGSSTGTYLTRSLRELGDRPEFLEIVLGNDKDQLAPRTSYKLGLTGPSIVVQTACSTSLVALHVAAQALLAGDCEIALVGAVSVMFPRREGYTYQSEGIYSRDGHCRAFDAAATGTVPGDGAGVVVLRLLDGARADGDRMRAVIKGTAVNNDGAHRAGYSAPSISGQAAVIRAAQQVAGVSPASISYVEAHGTGTALGDPAEVTALTQAFRAGAGDTGFCAIGSVKSNIGHLDVAAGMAGLIKTVLALEHRVLPPTLHVERPNPRMDLDTSPFFISDRARDWPAGATPRRAGVSSFGMGGTNAHVILEEAGPVPASPVPASPVPPGPARRPARPSLLLLSARTEAALDAATSRLGGYLTDHPDARLADVAYTTQAGRRTFEFRRFLVASDPASAAAALAGPAPRPRARRGPALAPPVVFMLPGQGAQHAGMAAGLYAAEPDFAAEFDRCCAHLPADVAAQVRQLVTAQDQPARDQPAEHESAQPGAADGPDATRLAQPALFAVEYALARLWQSWGVPPRALIGHSLGEYVAACLAGVFTLPDALRLVTERGRLMQSAPPGAMLSVHQSEADLGDLPAGVALAVVNAPDLCTVAGPEPGIADLEKDLAGRGVASRRLHTSRAFHSAMMAAAAAELEAAIATLPARPPVIPVISNVTGEWLTGEQATSPAYWARHTLAPVRFAAGLATALADGPAALLEVGPGQTLTALARRGAGRGGTVIPSMRHPGASRDGDGDGPADDLVALELALGAAWSAGVAIDWRRRHAGPDGLGRPCARLSLPTYPFQRQRYWLAQPAPSGPAAPAASSPPAAGRDQGAADPPEADAAPAVGGPEPHADIAAALVALWVELLGVETVDPDDNFFELGGHSLLGTRLIARLREAFGVELRLRDLLAMPTVAEQAALVAALADTEEGEL